MSFLQSELSVFMSFLSGSQSGVKSRIKKIVQDRVLVRCLQGGVVIHVTFKYLCGVWNYHKVDNQPKY